MKHEICICAAFKAQTGEVIRGHRHSDCIATMLNIGLKPDLAFTAQGFITSENRFVTRQEGYELQIAAGIKSFDKDGYRNKFLFSEDLY